MLGSPGSSRGYIWIHAEHVAHSKLASLEWPFIWSPTTLPARATNATDNPGQLLRAEAGTAAGDLRAPVDNGRGFLCRDTRLLLLGYRRLLSNSSALASQSRAIRCKSAAIVGGSTSAILRSSSALLRRKLIS
jgi:hypothetical protein